MTNAVIIGGGAAGFFSAISYAKQHPDHQVMILEKTGSLLSKVKISGGGRCNVTHACFDPAALCHFYPRGSKALRGPFQSFQPQDTMQWFKDRGVALKIESDNRVFPVSDDSQTIIDCLVSEARRVGVTVRTQVGVQSLRRGDVGIIIDLESGESLNAERVILATGSNRKGHQLAMDLGHSIVTPIPSLFTVKVKDKALQSLQGLSIPNVRVWLEGQKKRFQDGPLLVTHWGLSGPSIIKLSAWQAETFHHANYHVRLIVSLAPAFNEETLYHHFVSWAKDHPKKQLSTLCPIEEVPNRFWSYLIDRSGLSPSLTWNALAPKSLQQLTRLCTGCSFDVSGTSPFKDEFVTCGGVELSEINFKTMESKLCPGLHVVGEALNIDGVTGGFNFQNAWTTGYLAGQAH